MQIRKKPRNLLHWLGLTEDPNWDRARTLGSLFGFLLLFLFILCALAAFVVVGTTIWSAFQPSAAGPNLGTGALITGLLGAPFLVWRTIVAQKTVDLQREGHITDRIAKAVEQLGAEKTIKRIHEIHRYRKEDGQWMYDSNGQLIPALRPDGTPLIDRESHEQTVPNIEVRIGGLYALERIAQDSMAHESGREHLTVMDIICAYIRENAPAKDLKWTEPNFDRKRPRSDIQIALTIIGRRSQAQTDLEAERRYRLDLRHCDLDGCDFRGGNFSAAKFHFSRFEAAMFNEARLHGTQFYGALLNFASFSNAELVGSILDKCILNRPGNGWLSAFSPITMKSFEGVSLAGADISAVSSLGGADYIRRSFGARDTVLSANLEHKRSQIFQTLELCDLVGDEPDDQLTAEDRRMLEESGFSCWSPYDSSDGVTPYLQKKFLDSLGLHHWPYQEV